MANRLKSLELQGYKTFASRNVFKFPHALTAVVGPNGSGKSNVADAIRWVLGEQSFSLLRARKTEDMIFSGSDGRARAGMATATITFDNEDGWLPVDFSEVSITRHAYRDGQNEYLINNQRVRLKEVYELLAQSGLAQRTYTVIGQGLVDAALSLKPDERRKFFEEAAGISLYRERRQEAQDRLIATRRNVERVNDILGELEPRMASLERQAKRVIDFHRIQADLKVLMKDWYGYHWHRGQEAFNAARITSQNQEDKLIVTRTEYEEAEKMVAEQRSRIIHLRETLNGYLAESGRLHNEREQHLRQIAVLDERARALTTQRNQLETDLARLKDDQQMQSDRIAAVRQEAEGLSSEIEDARAHLAAEQAKLDEHRTVKQAYDERLGSARATKAQHETAKARLEAQLAELTHRREQQTASSTRFQQGLADLANEETQAADRLALADERVRTIQAELDQARTKLRENRDAIAESQAKTFDTQTKLRDQQAAISRLRTQIDLLQQAENSYSGLNEGARQLLERLKRSNGSARLQALSQMMEVKEGYERAIASALGEYMDALVLPEEMLDGALDLLLSNDKGRAILVPLDMNAEMAITAQAMQGISAETALSLITAKQGYERLFQALLGKFAVTDTRAEARRLAGRLSDGQAAVTREGEVFWHHGAVKGGRENRAGVIARPRQLKDLSESLQTALDREDAVRKEGSEYNDKLANLRVAENEFAVTERKLAAELNQAQAALQQAQMLASQASQKRAMISEQMETLRGQAVELEQEAKNRTAELAQTVEKLQEAEQALHEITRQDYQTGLDELQLQVNHWMTQVAVLTHTLTQSDQRLLDYELNLRKMDENAETSGQRIARFNSEAEAIEREKVENTAQSDRLGIEIAALQEKITPVDADLKAQEAAYDTQQAANSELQQRLTHAERLTAQTQMEVTRRKEALENLQKRIEDDFGLVTLEYTTDVSGPKPLPFEGMVQQLMPIEQISPEIEESITRNKALLRRMGAINPEAHKEYAEVKERFEYLTAQVADLKQADEDLMAVISELNEIMKQEFSKTFTLVAAEFKTMFTQLFGGGTARLILTDEENISDAGIEIEARLPGRREQGLALLSGGERSLTAVALIFALLKVSPTPFCVLDEVDAALDEANVGRFGELLKSLSEKTQFIVITHNRNTVEISGVIYGVTMGKDSTSQVVSLMLDEVSEDMVGGRR